jgi:hypothetical protein
MVLNNKDLETIKKIEFRLPRLTDEDLRLVSAFIRGLDT